MFSAASKTDNVSSAANYIEDVFSTYLYKGNGTATQPIPNGLQLGGLPANGTVLQLTGDTLTDSAPVPCGITVSGVSVSTSVKKYGTGSYSYSGASTSNLIATSPDLAVGTGDFTVECWVYATSAVNQGVFQLGSDFTGAGNNVGLAMYPANQFQWGWDASYTGGVGSWPLNTWVYVAIVRQAGVMKLYVNGVKTGADNTYAGNINFGRCWVGNYYDGNQGFNGYIDDFRITNKALYTSNFTPPSQALPLDTLVAGSNYGGLVWVKSRTSASNNWLIDTNRGILKGISSEITAAEVSYPNSVNGFASTGFSLGSNGDWNSASNNYVSWTFRKQPKFFDIVTYTGNGTANNTIPHALGSTVGAIFIKNITNGSNWIVWHRSNSNEILCLNLTNANVGSYSGYVHDVTSTSFQVGTSGQPNPGTTNSSGDTYVAYLFAHDAGGFGTAGTDNVISCGSFTTNGSGIGSVTLGWEPQFVLLKVTSTTGDWQILDSMRGFTAAPNASNQILNPNLSSAEFNQSGGVAPNATGFASVNAGLSGSQNYIYIAIRRGPMKTPTSGTSVFSPTKATFSGSTVTNTGFVTDLVINKVGTNTTNNNFVFDRLRGSNNSTGQYVLPSTSSTSAETATSGYLALTAKTVTIQNGFLAQNTTANNMVWAFARAPGFFDEVCYTGTGANRSLSHNLGVVPEFMIAKSRSGAYAWVVYHKDLGATKFLFLNYDAAVQTGNEAWNDTSPTSTQFTVSLSNYTGANATTYVAYLFASCPGVSKVGSYSGTGATQTISCGFAARFVLIKRTDSTGNWWVWDTARGMVAGTDPRLAFNVTDAESNANWVYTDASGFQIVTTDATVNASGGTYIYLAIA